LSLNGLTLTDSRIYTDLGNVPTSCGEKIQVPQYECSAFVVGVMNRGLKGIESLWVILATRGSD
jgi:hypothetical protein